MSNPEGEDRSDSNRQQAGPGDPRVHLAAERTLLAWIRTGLALMGFGFVVARFGLFLRELASARGATSPHPGGWSLWAGTALVLLGVLVNVLAGVEHARFLRGFRKGQLPPPSRFSAGILLSIILALLGLARALYLILTR